MEVHHHSHKPKNWKEYITEFIMLFAAVTLGFLAENLREHQVISHRIEQNKVAILKDLQEDSTDIARVLNFEDTCINRFNRINNILYLAKTKKINYNQLVDSIKASPNLIAFASTLYMNNSSYKNMQSSGLLSNLDEGELKSSLATYYEVVFKNLEAVNEFFDQIGNVYNNFVPIGYGKIVRRKNKFEKAYELNDPDVYINFMLSLDKSKKDLQSDEFIYEVQKYYNYIFVYRNSLKRAKESNDKLLKILRSEIN
jgi:hypothetical protein